MVPQASLLIALVGVVEVIPSPPSQRSEVRGGRPRVSTDRLFLQALVIMLVRDVSTASGRLAILEQPTWELQLLRAHLTERGRFPSRRTWERRLAAIPNSLPARIGCLGRPLVGPSKSRRASGAQRRRALGAQGREDRREPAHELTSPGGWTSAGDSTFQSASPGPRRCSRRRRDGAKSR
jgi:hypothetical protein